jgi:hypothetical protein
VANRRQSEIKDVSVKVFAVVRKDDSWTSMVPLKLVKEDMPELSVYPWTVIHYIDEDSPVRFFFSSFSSSSKIKY